MFHNFKITSLIAITVFDICEENGVPIYLPSNQQKVALEECSRIMLGYG